MARLHLLEQKLTEKYNQSRTQGNLYSCPLALKGDCQNLREIDELSFRIKNECVQCQSVLEVRKF